MRKLASSLSLIVLTWAFSGCSGCGGCGEPEPQIDPPAVTKNEPPPKPAEPQPTEPPPIETSTNSADEMKAALLGLNKAESVLAAKPAPAKPRRPIRRYIEDTVPDEPPAPPETLSEQMFYSALGKWDGIKRCLATTPAVGPSERKGSLQIGFVVANDGSVMETRVFDLQGDARDIKKCVDKEAERVRFPSFTKDKPVTKAGKFVF